MEAGRLTIVKTGKILADQIFLIGEFTAPQYNVTLVGPKVVLKGLGNQTAGTSIFTDVAILKTADALSPELFRTPVVCETAWAFVP